MTINQHLSEFAGLEVTSWEPGQSLSNPASTVPRVAVEYDDAQSWTSKFRVLLELPGVADLQGLVVGMSDTEAGTDGNPQEMIEALVAAHAQLPKLRALFINDITSEENEISWIPNDDLSPIFAAYPGLEHLGIRGGNGLSVGRLVLPELRSLVIQAGGLSRELVREVMSAELPKLEHLELYLGTEDYGATCTPEDLSPILDGKLFPALKYLGLKNSEHQDAIAQIVAQAPVLEGLETLDLSMGILTDEGAQALVTSPLVAKLKKLDVSQSWCSDEMVAKLKALPTEVDASEQQEQEEGDDWRYVSLGE